MKTIELTVGYGENPSDDFVPAGSEMEVTWGDIPYRRRIFFGIERNTNVGELVATIRSKFGEYNDYYVVIITND